MREISGVRQLWLEAAKLNPFERVGAEEVDG